MILSIVIPCYNVDVYILSCLDSIFLQGVDEQYFEVICVDDCSPNKATCDMVAEYSVNGEHPRNLRLERLSVNMKRGGACNAGVCAAKGDYVMTVDADDYLIKGSLKRLLKVLEENVGLDLIMDDCVFEKENKRCDSEYASCNQSEVMSGADFYMTQRLAWTSWMYLYRRECFYSNNVWFVDNHMFEDTDFVLRYIVRAMRCRYVNVKVYCKNEHPSRFSIVGNDYGKTRDFFQLVARMVEFLMNEKNAGEVYVGKLIQDTCFLYKYAVRHFLWRMPANKQLQLLRIASFPDKTDDRLVNFASFHPRVLVAISVVMKPFLSLGSFFLSYTRK